MAKNKRRKVKHYRRSFYSRGMQVRRAVGIGVLVVVVLAAAWLAAPYVLDWATHTWYTVVRDRDLSASSPAVSESLTGEQQAASDAASSAAQSQPEQEPAPEPEPETPAADPTAVVEGPWARAELSALTDEASIRAEARRLADQGAVYALVPLKDSQGALYATSVPAAASGIHGSVDGAVVARIFQQEGLVPVAQLEAFRDPLAARADRSMAIRYRSPDSGATDYLWLDAASAEAGGKPWLNPYADTAVRYVAALLEETRQMGFAHAALQGVQFPGQVSSKQEFGVTGARPRDEQLAADIAAWQTQFEGSLTLWLSYPLSSCTGSPSSLGAPAAQLGMRRLLVRLPADSGLDPQARAELADSLAAQGPEHVMLLG